MITALIALVMLHIQPNRVHADVSDETSCALQDMTLEKIAICESENTPKAHNASSSAKGRFQIIDGTWAAYKCEGNVLDWDDNTRCAEKISKDGYGAWSASRQCWSK